MNERNKNSSIIQKIHVIQQKMNCEKLIKDGM